MHFNFDNFNFNYDPYPVGIAKQVFSQEDYQQLITSYPPSEIFKKVDGIGKGYKSVKPKNNKKNYNEFIQNSPPWQKLYLWVKSNDFIIQTLNMLVEHQINLGTNQHDLDWRRRLRYFLRGLKHGNLLGASKSLRTEMIFISLSANQGCLMPHTDRPGKLATFILPMIQLDEWNTELGGHTSINQPKDGRLTFNFNRLKKLDFTAVDELYNVPYAANQCLILINTLNGWHSVPPMQGQNSNLTRKTVIINILKNYHSPIWSQF